ncbi:hypothetical protein M728_004047 (plasmid) [Ensifer sp. WSM1721]|uniref:hypothetical protein n=1 Tax=Ensifer sp. WSM1721 TaxID=1041159 RepID=UPI00047E9BE1|nr:hypothetical protein [Ensifer sp. WSM1721]
MNSAFINPLARGTPAVVSRARAIKQWTREALTLSDDAVVSVNELSCRVPGCPPKETVVLVMRGARTMQVSIHKAMQELTAADIALAFATMAERLD